MLYREIIAVCSEIHTKHINTLCGQNVEFVNVKPLGFKRLKADVKGISFGLDSSGSGYGSTVQWRTLVDSVINLRILSKASKVLTQLLQQVRL
jgi:hypothetical protein